MPIGFGMNKKCEIFIPLFLFLMAPRFALAQTPGFTTQEAYDEKVYITELDSMLHQRTNLRKQHIEKINVINQKNTQYLEVYKKAVKAEQEVDEKCEDLTRKSADNCPNLKQSASNAVMYAKLTIDASKDKIEAADQDFHSDYDKLEAPMVKYQRALFAMNSTSKWASGPLPPQVKSQLAKKDALLIEEKAKGMADLDAAVTKLKTQLKAASELNSKLAGKLRIAILKLNNCQGNPSGKQSHVSNAVGDQKAEAPRNTDSVDELTPTAPILMRQADSDNAIPAVLPVPQAAPKAK